MAQKDKQTQAADAPAEEFVVPAPHPDAAAYVLQPTSQKLTVDVVGEIPPNRFQEEVLKGSDEEDSSTPSTDAHPVENQPAYGVTQEGGQPDTTGRKRS